MVMLYMTLFSMYVSNAQQASTTLDLYLLIGQSNMAGRGVVTNEFKMKAVLVYRCWKQMTIVDGKYHQQFGVKENDIYFIKLVKI